MLIGANKWIKDTIKPYKHENQKIRDQRQLIDGIVNFFVGTIKLLFRLINLMFIVPIKALAVDYKNFTAKYKEIGQGDIAKIIPTFQQAVTGFVQLLTAPILPFRIILRLILTPLGGVSVFTNEDLKKLVDEYFKNTPYQSQSAISTLAVTKEDRLENIETKAKKYSQNKQKDSAELSKILAKPILTYYKMQEIKAKIESQAGMTSKQQLNI